MAPFFKGPKTLRPQYLGLGEELSKKIRVFDMLSYGEPFEDLPININHHGDKLISKRITDIQKIIKTIHRTEISA